MPLGSVLDRVVVARDYGGLVRQTRLASYAALVVATFIATLSIGSMFATRHSALWAGHAQEVAGAAREVGRATAAAVVNQRSYLLTGDPHYRVAYGVAVGRTHAALREFAQLSADNPDQRQRARTLDHILAVRFAQLDSELRAGPAGPHGIPPLDPRVDHRRASEVRAVIADAVAEEMALSELRLEHVNLHIWMAAIAVAIGFLASVLLVWTVNTRLLRAIRARERAERAAVEAREAADAANHAKSDFLARMSHELRTPLNSVIGFANVLLRNRDKHLSATDVTYLSRIQANGTHLLSLINQILDLAKIEAGHMDVHVEAVDVALLAREVALQFEPQLRDRPVELRVAAPSMPTVVNTDPEKLRQILINLVGNAMKFTERGSVTIAVVTRATGEVESIAVHDSGLGIPADRLAAIFEAFEQADTGTARRFGGTGLGLSISRSLAALLGVTLDAVSRPGEGSTFTLRFPAVEPMPTPARGVQVFHAVTAVPGGAGRQAAFRGRHFLVIDDDPDARTLIAGHLQELGARVTAAADGEHGLRLAARERPDAILLDLRMEHVSGEQVLLRMAGDPAVRGIPVVVVSIVAGEPEARLDGVAAMVSKPVTRDSLAAALGTALGERRTGTPRTASIL